MSHLSVFSEIGRLETVAIHRPGPEVDCMTPALMHDLLFDDILFGPEAREEHDLFAGVLGLVADQVVDVQSLFARALQVEEARHHFLTGFCSLHGLTQDEREDLASWDADTLAHHAIGGWYVDIDHGADYRFRFPPVPNLLFMRDPAAVIGDGVSINNMATSARQPEPFILDTILRYHPEFKVSDLSKMWFNNLASHRKKTAGANQTIEGGDILVLSEDILAVGISIRTSQSAVTRLAEKIRANGHFKTLLAVLMPQERSAMHLDTIFTRIDHEHCLVFPPYLLPDHQQTLPVVKMDLTGDVLQVALKPNFLDALAEEGLSLKPVLCGGRNRLDQEREQWTDGANAFCLAPGVIIGYSRNTRTAEELAKVGYAILNARDLVHQSPNLLDGGRYFIGIPGNELSRARGGPRCMTMPLRRASV